MDEDIDKILNTCHESFSRKKDNEDKKDLIRYFSFINIINCLTSYNSDYIISDEHKSLIRNDFIRQSTHIKNILEEIKKDTDTNGIREIVFLMHELLNFSNQLVYLYCKTNNIDNFDLKTSREELQLKLVTWRMPELYQGFFINNRQKKISFQVLIADVSIGIFPIIELFTSAIADSPTLVKVASSTGGITQENEIQNLIKKDILKNNLINEKDEEGKTLLHYAAELNSSSVLEQLIEYGADINAVDAKGNSVLHYAALLNDYSVIECLIENKAGINIVNKQGDSVLHYAAKSNKLDVIKLIVENGAFIYAMNREGQTALHTAVAHNSVDVVQYLNDSDKSPKNYAVKVFEQSLINSANQNTANKDVVNYLNNSFNENNAEVNNEENIKKERNLTGKRLKKLNPANWF